MKFLLSVAVYLGHLPLSAYEFPIDDQRGVLESVQRYAKTGDKEKVVLVTTSKASKKSILPNQSPLWVSCMKGAITAMGTGGGYSVKEDAHDALARSFRYDSLKDTPLFTPAYLRPSFCSGAVYSTVLLALMKWEKALLEKRRSHRRQISTKAWKSLFPLRYKDGEHAWGWANANGPGFAVLIHALAAGMNFTDWKEAQPYDIIKIWWTTELGGKERGHLAIVLELTPTHVTYWSSNQASDGTPAGLGAKTVSRSKIKRVLFTRITTPSAFDKASSIGESRWLFDLLRHPTSWEECLKRSGVKH